MILSKKALIAMGTNLAFGDLPRESVLELAIQHMDERLGMVRAQSKVFSTPAFPKGNGPSFLNTAITLQTTLEADNLLINLHKIEEEFGRDRQDRWGPRTLDLDLIALGDQVLPDAETHRKWREMPLEMQMNRTPDGLILPHPRLQDRAFVLVPLAEIAPGWTHPLLKKTLRQLCDDLSNEARSEVTPL